MFEKETWKDRVSEYPNRRLLVNSDTSEQSIVTVSRSEGTITEEGTPFSAANMNGLENRIKTETDFLESDIASVQSGSTATKSFRAGDYFLNDGKLYKAKGNISAGSALPGNSDRINLADEIKSTKNSVNDLTSTVQSMATTMAGKPTLVVSQKQLSLDSTGKQAISIDLSQYKSGTEAYVPVTVTGIGTLEGFSISITNARLSNYTVEIKRLTGTITNPRVLISYYIM